MKVQLRLRGDQEVRAELRRLARGYPEATGAALYQEGQELGLLAREKAPVDEEDLERSMYVALPERESGQLVVEVGFGTDYAVIQHERLDLKHENGEAKYLERAGKERARGLLQRLAQAIPELVARRLSARSVSARAPTRPLEPPKG